MRSLRRRSLAEAAWRRALRSLCPGSRSPIQTKVSSSGDASASGSGGCGERVTRLGGAPSASGAVAALEEPAGAVPRGPPSTRRGLAAASAEARGPVTVCGGRSRWDVVPHDEISIARLALANESSSSRRRSEGRRARMRRARNPRVEIFGVRWCDPSMGFLGFAVQRDSGAEVAIWVGHLSLTVLCQEGRRGRGRPPTSSLPDLASSEPRGGFTESCKAHTEGARGFAPSSVEPRPTSFEAHTACWA